MTGHRPEMSRRQLLQLLLGSQAALFVGCSSVVDRISGKLLQPSVELGHKIRDGLRLSIDWTQADSQQVVIVGGGIAGLTAAWRLKRAGFDSFSVLELETVPGGTARSGQTGKLEFPWGAHYVPTPMKQQRGLIALLSEMGVVIGSNGQGEPVVAEQHLCREPEERIYIDGQWLEGLYPMAGASEDDLAQLERFRQQVGLWSQRTDAQGRRMFAIPVASGSDSEEVRELDQLTMSQWLDRQGFTSPRLRWLVDYSCRDDYGLTSDQTSAWAGLFYFASRADEAGQTYQEVITWPAGNGEVVKYLAGAVQSHLRTGHAVVQIAPGSKNVPAEVGLWRTDQQSAVGMRAEHVLFSAPQFVAPYVIEGYREQRQQAVNAFQYGSWVVANLHLKGRPREATGMMCWDNVFYDSKSLGYVCATHQLGADHGPTVLTWYLPMSEVEGKVSRQQLLQLQWSDWVETILADLTPAHPDLPELVQQIDVMYWGHAMIQPRPGFVWSEARREAGAPFGRVRFANTDLSGVALLEEAFFHGVRGAEEIMTALGHEFDSIL